MHCTGDTMLIESKTPDKNDVMAPTRTIGGVSLELPLAAPLACIGVLAFDRGVLAAMAQQTAANGRAKADDSAVECELCLPPATALAI
jgi:hypothetical protein